MKCKELRQCAVLLAMSAALPLLTSCNLIINTLSTGGTQHLTRHAPPPSTTGPHMIVFALDGAVPASLMAAIRSGQAPNLAALLGAEKGGGLFEHAYAAPNALSVLPSSTIADWSAVFTGQPPASNGVTGDEWFDRRSAIFYAPVPVSTSDITDNSKVVTDDLVGKALAVPTLYELLGSRSYVSMLSVHRGATYYTTVEPGSLADLFEHLIKGALKGRDPERSLSGSLDRESVKKIVETIEQHGVPDLQVVYFPGIDIFTHAAKDPLVSQVRYLERVTDPGIGAVLDEYRKQGVDDNTYVIFISDHAHIPTMPDELHRLGTDEDDSPYEAVSSAGFRVRRPRLLLADLDRDFQAVLAYQGFMAFVYLADRSTCAEEDQPCDWTRPPRFDQDVMPVVRALARSNVRGQPVSRLRGTIDLIFARHPAAPGDKAAPFEIFDGRRLVPINEYLKSHRRPDLVDLERRMNWLSAGPYGDRAGDILLLPRACMNLPIEQRFYFSANRYYSWHGSACRQDSNIVFILAQQAGSGERMRSILGKFGGDAPSEMQMTPLVLRLFGKTPE